MTRQAIIILSLVLVTITEIHGHGMMMEPVGRGSAWRKGFKTPANYNDNANYCGGRGVQHGRNKGKCGVCGDDYSQKQPRAHENGGVYGTGTIVRTYKSGSTIDLAVKLTASHMGHFEFSICPLKFKGDIETEECFKQYPLLLSTGGYKYYVKSSGNSMHNMKVVLPQNLTCKHCSIRWHYRTGNSWGICPDGRGRNGCGPQETFRTCSDIQIL